MGLNPEVLAEKFKEQMMIPSRQLQKKINSDLKKVNEVKRE